MGPSLPSAGWLGPRLHFGRRKRRLWPGLLVFRANELNIAMGWLLSSRSKQEASVPARVAGASSLKRLGA